jgi:hypothetical protein
MNRAASVIGALVAGKVHQHALSVFLLFSLHCERVISKWSVTDENSEGFKMTVFNREYA